MSKLLVIFLLLSNSLTLQGQTTDSLQEKQEIYSEEITPVPLKFEEEKLRSFKEDPDFNYTEDIQEDNWWTSFKRYISMQWKKLLNWLFGDLEASPLLAFFLKSLPYLLVILALSLLVYMFTRLDLGETFLKTPGKGSVVLDEEENIIRFEDIKELIAKAVSNNDFRLAVRYHFLYILQQMSLTGIVTYDSTKTDEDYLNEIKKENLKPIFKKLNRIYDFVWYGHFETGEEVYLRIQKEFQEMEIRIKTKNEQIL